MAAARRGAAQPAPPAPKAKITSSAALWTLQGTFGEKLEAAARAGLQSVELSGEYTRWTDLDVARIRRACRSFGLGFDALPATPEWNRRPVSMVDPAQREGFLAALKQAIEYARKLEIPQIVLLPGNAIAERTREEQYGSLLEGTKRAGDLAAQAGVTLIVEPLNERVDHPGFFLTTCSEGLKLVREVDNPHVKLLFDVYHEQVQTGDAIRTLAAAAPYTAVFHIADSPGRHEPGTGGIDYRNVYRAIQKSGFSGYVCMEYLPAGEQVASLTRAVDEFRTAIASAA